MVMDQVQTMTGGGGTGDAGLGANRGDYNIHDGERDGGYDIEPAAIILTRGKEGSNREVW